MNSFGRIFRISIFGESHGKSLGILIDGCPAGILLEESNFMKDLLRRKSGAKGTTPRIEPDIPEITSGIFNGRTTGAPILIFFKNKNIQSHEYEKIKDIPRPGHADFTAIKKFGGFNDFRGGGHFSGRITIGLVAAGIIAKKVIAPMNVQARLEEAGGESNIENAIKKALTKKNTIGGIVECKVRNVPIGLGEPFFDPVESLLSHLIFSIPGIRAIEFGSGFQSARMTGKEHNDLIIDTNGKTETNNAGGINGGITNGNSIWFRAAVKPPSGIPGMQKTVNLKTGKKTDLLIKGRHDVCIALRVPVIIEAAASIVLADLLLLNQKVTRGF